MECIEGKNEITGILVLEKEYSGAESSEDSITKIKFRVTFSNNTVYTYILEASPYLIYNFLKKVRFGYFKQAMNMVRGRAINVRILDLAESTIDFPQEDLDKGIWDKVDGMYTIKEDVKANIYNILSQYPDFSLGRLADAIHITGSIGTNQYTESTDIDIHILPDVEKFKQVTGARTDKELEVAQQKVKKWFVNHVPEFTVNTHPVEVYIQLVPKQELISDAVYSLKTDEWVRGPGLVDFDFDPYSTYADILKEMQSGMKDFDKLIGELKRDVIDYEVFKKAIAKLPRDVKQELLAKLRAKLVEIEDSIDKLLDKKQDYVDMRKQSSRPDNPELALKDAKYAKRWRDTNVMFKFINRYQYLKVATELENMLKDDDKISDEDVNKISSLLGVMK